MLRDVARVKLVAGPRHDQVVGHGQHPLPLAPGGDLLPGVGTHHEEEPGRVAVESEEARQGLDRVRALGRFEFEARGLEARLALCRQRQHGVAVEGRADPTVALVRGDVRRDEDQLVEREEFEQPPRDGKVADVDWVETPAVERDALPPPHRTPLSQP
jgi:hypothetical protein